MLEAKGHSVINAPVTAIIGESPTIPPLDDVAGTIFSSAAAVPHVPARVRLACQHLPCLAVGPATAIALERDGWTGVSHFGGEMTRLLEALAAHTSSGRWLYPCGRQLAHDPVVMASRAGKEIHRLTVYEAQALGPWTQDTVDALRSVKIEAALFLSVRTADLVIENCAQAGLWSGGAPGVAGCISGRVADAIAPLGYRDIVVSTEKTTSSLVAAMGLS